MKSDFVVNIYNHSPIWLQNIFCSIIGFEYKRYRFGKKFQKKLEFLEKSQWWGETDFNNYQNEKLAEFINHAYSTTSYYHNLFKSLKLSPNDFKNRDDLKKLPILEKQFVKGNHEKFVSGAFSKFDLVKKIYQRHNRKRLKDLLYKRCFASRKCFCLAAAQIIWCRY